MVQRARGVKPGHCLQPRAPSMCDQNQGAQGTHLGSGTPPTPQPPSRVPAASLVYMAWEVKVSFCASWAGCAGCWLKRQDSRKGAGSRVALHSDDPGSIPDTHMVPEHCQGLLLSKEPGGSLSTAVCDPNTPLSKEKSRVVETTRDGEIAQ